MEELTAEKMREEIEGGFDGIVELIGGNGLDSGYAELLCECTEEEFREILSFFDEFDVLWKMHLDPIISKIVARQVLAARRGSGDNK